MKIIHYYVIMLLCYLVRGEKRGFQSNQSINRSIDHDVIRRGMFDSNM